MSFNKTKVQLAERGVGESSWRMLWGLMSDSNASKCSSGGFCNSVANNSKFAVAPLLLFYTFSFSVKVFSVIPLLLFPFPYSLILYPLNFKDSLPTSTADATKQDFWTAYAATITFHQQHRFYRKTIYCFM